MFRPKTFSNFHISTFSQLVAASAVFQITSHADFPLFC